MREHRGCEGALAELADPQQPTEAAQVGAGVQLMLDQLDPLPAVVVGPRWEILAGNRAHLGLIGDYHALPFEYRNVMWMCFTDPHWRTLVASWEENARRMVAKLRTAMAEHVGDPSRTASSSAATRRQARLMSR